MKQFYIKLKNFSYNKTTFMMIPHTEKGVTSFSFTNINLLVLGLFFFVLTATGLTLSFKISDKMADYEFNQVEYNKYQSQVENIQELLPRFKKSQNALFYKLDEIFNLLGVENKYRLQIQDKLNRITLKAHLENINYKIENVSDYINHFELLFEKIPSSFPLLTKTYWFSSGFGVRIHPITGKSELHTGQDISAYPGTPIQATADGIVSFSGIAGGYGNLVEIDHKSGYLTRYAHMMRTAVNAGATVKKGQIIGYVGTTGVSTGYHLHYEVILNNEYLDPKKYLFINQFGTLP